MTKELLQQALDALESMESLVDGYYIPRGKQYTPECEAAIDAIRAHLAAQPAPVPVPPGWKLVPVEPTPEMILDGCDAIKPGGFVEDIYAAMIAASPEKP